MSNAPQGPDWFQATNGKWYPPGKPKAPEAPWVGPAAWLLFIGGFALAVIGSASAALLGVGVVAVLVGLVMLAATGRIIPSGKR